MRKTLSALYPLVVFAALSVSAHAQTAKSAGDYWPLKQGNTWTLTTTANGQKTSQVITVSKVTSENGGVLATLEYKTNGILAFTETYRVTQTTMERTETGGAAAAKINPPFPMIRFPLTAGKKWTWKGTMEIQGMKANGTSTLSVSGPFTMKTPVGTFKTMKVHSELKISAQGQAMTMPNDYWFAPGVGLVQQQAQIGKLKIFGQITGYKLKK